MKAIVISLLLGVLSHGFPAWAETEEEKAAIERGWEAYYKGDYETAALIWKDMSYRGVVNSWYPLGLLYFDGLGVPKDRKIALIYMTDAADATVPIANETLGWWYWYGTGVPENKPRACNYFNKAFKLHKYSGLMGMAYCNIQKIYENYDLEEGRALMEAAVVLDKDNTEKILTLADMYYYGLFGDTNYERARELYMIALGKGAVEGYIRVGLMHFFGKGFPQDYTKALGLFLKAADLGNSEGLFLASDHYLLGLGVDQDKPLGMKMLKKAADAGYANAQVKLGLIFISANRSPNDFLAAEYWFEKAAAQGNEEAKGYLDGTRKHDLWKKTFPEMLADSAK